MAVGHTKALPLFRALDDFHCCSLPGGTSNALTLHETPNSIRAWRSHHPPSLCMQEGGEPTGTEHLVSHSPAITPQPECILLQALTHMGPNIPALHNIQPCKTHPVTLATLSSTAESAYSKLFLLFELALFFCFSTRSLFFLVLSLRGTPSTQQCSQSALCCLTLHTLLVVGFSLPSLCSQLSHLQLFLHHSSLEGGQAAEGALLIATTWQVLTAAPVGHTYSLGVQSESVVERGKARSLGGGGDSQSVG